MKEIGATRQQVQKTVALYNSIMEAKAKDARKTYNDLVKAIERCEKKAGDVRVKTEEMEGEAHKFFAEWTKSLDGIENQDLRQRGQKRLNETRVGYGEILASGRRAGAEFQPFIAALHDQVVYLGYDLNPSAVASLEEDAKKLNTQATVLFDKIDEVMEATDNYIRSLRPE
jgi:hypothetical protein